MVSSIFTVAIVMAVCCLVLASTDSPKRSRATVHEKKMSLRGQKYAAHMDNARQEAESKREVDPEAEAEARIARQIEEMNDPKLTPEERAMHQREIDKDKARLAEGRKRKKYDPYADMKKRAAAGRMDHHVQIDIPHVDPEEPIVDLIAYNGTNLEGFFGETNSFVAILVIDENCEHCQEAFDAFNRVSKKFAHEEFPVPHEHRLLRYAYLNATENRTRYNELLAKLHFARAEIHHLPSTMFVHLRAHWHHDSVPHYVPYRQGKYESDLTHYMRRIVDVTHSRFRNEDELMHCAFETSNDGVAFVFFRDSDYIARKFPQFGKLLTRAVGELQHHIPVCRYTERVHEGEGNVTVGGEVFHSMYNPDNADLVAFMVNENNADEIIPESFTISEEIIKSPDPPMSVRILETQRLRRWIESILARRHNASGRRFRDVRRRYQWQTHGHPHCADGASKAGDTVRASIRATSVEHNLVFAELKLQKFVAGDAIPGLPPYLHSVLVGLCPGHHEIFSPAGEGFHAELVHINVSEVIKPIPVATPVDPSQQQTGSLESEADVINGDL